MHEEEPSRSRDADFDQEDVPPIAVTPEIPTTPPMPERALEPPSAPQKPTPQPRKPANSSGGESSQQPNLPRRSQRNRDAPQKPGSVYPPGTIEDKDHRKKLPIPPPSPERVAPKRKAPVESQSKSKEMSDDEDDISDDEEGSSEDEVKNMLKLAQKAEKGEIEDLNRWFEYLLNHTDDLKIYNTKHGEPDPSQVRSWTFKDIARLPKEQQERWHAAMLEELLALKKHNVYTLCDLPPGRKAIKTRWVFDIKTDGRYRARLVAKGFSQIEGLDYDEIFSPVVRFETVRTILALSALEGWTIELLDVKTAFLYGELDKEIYMEQPQGFTAPGKERMVCRLHKAIYGLKQASRAWWLQLDKSLKQIRFKRIHSDAGLFVAQHSDGSYAIMLAYVDDLMLTGPNKSVIASKKQQFMEKWECRDLGVCKEFLRMHIQYQNGKIYLDQTAYLETILKRFGMADAKLAETPMVTGYKPRSFEGTSTPELRKAYQSVSGSLLYLMLGSRPDIAYAVTQMAKHAANPSQEHLNHAMHIFKYLRGTRKYALVFDGPGGQGLDCYVDASYADQVGAKSTEGHFFRLAGAPVKWRTATQKVISTSTTMAEYIALHHAAEQAKWFLNLFQEIGKPYKHIPMYCDNLGADHNAINPANVKGLKHVDVGFHYIRERIEAGDIKLFYVRTDANPADLFTKNLGSHKFLEFRGHLGLEFYP